MKTVSVGEAVALIPDGASLMVGGFMGVGTPERLIDELVRQSRRDLAIIAPPATLSAFTFLQLLVHLPLVLFLLWALVYTLEYHPPVIP
jgi:acyl CoA:acetate/3-ketoacid CoA transferase alpha subunit